MGSLIFQNGPRLNDSNLSSLLVEPRAKRSHAAQPPLLAWIRLKLETEMEQYFGEAPTFADALINDENFEMLKKLDLISTQLVYNLTIPAQVASTNATESTTSSITCISEHYKLKCSNLLMRVVRFHRASAGVCSDANGEDFKVNRSKILIKALQGMENLFNSIKASNSQGVELVWLKMNGCDQLGDILAFVKVGSIRKISF